MFLGVDIGVVFQRFQVGDHFGGTRQFYRQALFEGSRQAVSFPYGVACGNNKWTSMIWR